MKTLKLQIVTLDGLLFDGSVEKVSVRSVEGNVGICPGHIDYVTVIDVGYCEIITEGERRLAACTDGFLSVSDDRVKVVATTFEWADEIDVSRADTAYNKAKTALEDDQQENLHSIQTLESKVKRALLRKEVGAKKNDKI